MIWFLCIVICSNNGSLPTLKYPEVASLGAANNVNAIDAPMLFSEVSAQQGVWVQRVDD
jgi:hypothetical protein